MHGHYASTPVAAIRGEKRLLQNVVKNTLSMGDEVHRDRRSDAGQETPQILEVFTGKEASWRDVSDQPAGPDPAERHIGEDPVQIRMAVEACRVAGPQPRIEGDPAIWRITDHEVVSGGVRSCFQAISNLDESKKAAIRRSTYWQQCSFEEHLRHPSRDRIDLEATNARRDVLE